MFSIEQEKAFEKYLSKENIFITGPGGCGKSHLLKSIYEDAKSKNKKIIITALTGCAAVLLHPKAKTIHSWSGIGIAKLTPKYLLKKILNNKSLKNNWKYSDILIIDEISMMSKKLFELLDFIGKNIRKTNLLFGGIQLILSGDFYQLPPISNMNNLNEEKEKNIDNIDSSLFCFESEIWKENFTINNIILLKTIFRQSDVKFINLLNQIRCGKIKKSTLKILNELKNKVKPENFEPTKLFPNRNQVNIINSLKLEQLEGDINIFNYKYVSPNDLDIDSNIERNIDETKNIELDLNKLKFTEDENIMNESMKTKIIEILKEEKKKKIIQKNKKINKNKISKEEIDYEFSIIENNMIVPKNLSLKIGSQVMNIINITLEKDLLLCNGEQGIIINFDALNGNPIVKFNNGLTRRIDYHFWFSENNPKIAIGQIPLILCWALTIHKSQGMSIEYAEIDVGSSVFECGQSYVALSRVKSLDGLYLKNFDINKIRVNKKVIEFYDNLEEIEEIKERQIREINIDYK